MQVLSKSSRDIANQPRIFSDDASQAANETSQGKENSPLEAAEADQETSLSGIEDPFVGNYNDVPLTEQPSDLRDISEHCECAG